MTQHTWTVDEPGTHTLAATLARAAHPGTAILLEGPLGAGKTRFVRGLADGLGVQPNLVSSPTYVLLNIYPTTNTRVTHLMHIDGYRLDTAIALESLGIEPDAIPTSLIAAEWPDRIADLPDRPRIHVAIEPTDPEHRRITLTGDIPDFPDP